MRYLAVSIRNKRVAEVGVSPSDFRRAERVLRAHVGHLAVIDEVPRPRCVDGALLGMDTILRLEKEQTK